MAREAGVPLMFTLSQLSYWSAKHLGDAGLKSMNVRGRMQEGMVADVVIFNPKIVAERSTYKKGQNGLSPKGMPHVIVNGKFVKKDNKATNVFPGQPIRYSVEKKGRFVPASKRQWLKTFTIDTSPLSPKAKPSNKSNSTKDGPLSFRSIRLRDQANAWFGDQRPEASLGGYCCEYHRRKTRGVNQEFTREIRK